MRLSHDFDWNLFTSNITEFTGQTSFWLLTSFSTKTWSFSKILPTAHFFKNWHELTNDKKSLVQAKQDRRPFNPSFQKKYKYSNVRPKNPEEPLGTQRSPMKLNEPKETLGNSMEP